MVFDKGLPLTAAYRGVSSEGSLLCPLGFAPPRLAWSFAAYRGVSSEGSLLCPLGFAPPRLAWSFAAYRRVSSEGSLLVRLDWLRLDGPSHLPAPPTAE
jgi:hypothetical protein